MGLVLHIGYPKAGSTSLQRCVFKFLPAALVPGSGDQEIRPLYRWVAFGPAARIDSTMVRRLEDWLEATADQPRLISEESVLGVRLDYLRSPSRFQNWTPAVNLSRALDRLSLDPAHVHVVLGIRPQVDWLPSLFAEAPPRGTSAVGCPRCCDSPLTRRGTH